MYKNSPIGVFDSGMGGLTVLKALREALPDESFIYLGDTARLPYGTKSPATVQQYAMQMVRILVKYHIKALVIACNTATTAALPYLQTMLPDIAVLGVVEPGAQAAAWATRNHHIAVLATETTIASLSYQRFITRLLPEAHISTQACSLLVALAEEGMTDNLIARATLKHYTAHLTHEDTLLLGCTHFPVFRPLLTELLPDAIKIVDSATATATALLKLLADKQLLNDKKDTANTRYLVTDSVERFKNIGALFLHQSLSAEDIELVDA